MEATNASPRQVVLVDDFGANEVDSLGYGQQAEARRARPAPPLPPMADRPPFTNAPTVASPTVDRLLTIGPRFAVSSSSSPIPERAAAPTLASLQQSFPEAEARPGDIQGSGIRG